VLDAPPIRKLAALLRHAHLLGLLVAVGARATRTDRAERRADHHDGVKETGARGPPAHHAENAAQGWFPGFVWMQYPWLRWVGSG